MRNFGVLKQKNCKNHSSMRKRFEPQLTLGSLPIEQIQIPLKSRDALPSLLRALQYVYTNKDVSDQVFRLLEACICTKKPTGRTGMDLWSIFVLASVRQCLNTDYDYLHHVANYDSLVRQILGVHDGIFRGRDFGLQNIKDNVHLLDAETLRKINCVIVQAGHQLVPKKGTEALRIKVDSFVVEANVHFPTDYNLLLDSGRKCIEVLEQLMDVNSAYCTGWRKIGNWLKRLKKSMLILSRATADKTPKGKENIAKAVAEYLLVARGLTCKLYNVEPLNPSDVVECVMFEQLNYFHRMLDKHIDLVHRRLVKGEKIPHEEKIFSIFEPWVEWICKGKAHKPVELGKLTCIASDQWHFILDWWVADHQTDNQMLLPVIDRIREYYKLLTSCSSDKGFFSKTDIEIMELFHIKAFIPKKGKRTLADIQRENDPEFIKAKRAHSAVESNINELEHRGLDRCPDKGIHGMHRYVGLAVIAYNLRRMGKILQQKDQEEARKKATKFRRAA
jgi:hypothetical protein